MKRPTTCRLQVGGKFDRPIFVQKTVDFKSPEPSGLSYTYRPLIDPDPE